MVHTSLRHYYTCHEGLKSADRLQDINDGYHKLESFGPLPWNTAGKAVQSVLLANDDGGTRIAKQSSNPLPKCADDFQ